MKLYTEEQAKYFFECGRNFQMNGEVTFNIAQDEVTPIELPSDEKLWEDFRIEHPNTVGGFQEQYECYKWTIEKLFNKIQGGNK